MSPSLYTSRFPKVLNFPNCVTSPSVVNFQVLSPSLLEVVMLPDRSIFVATLPPSLITVKSHLCSTAFVSLFNLYITFSSLVPPYITTKLPSVTVKSFWLPILTSYALNIIKFDKGSLASLPVPPVELPHSMAPFRSEVYLFLSSFICP